MVSQIEKYIKLWSATRYSRDVKSGTYFSITLIYDQVMTRNNTIRHGKCYEELHNAYAGDDSAEESYRWVRFHNKRYGEGLIVVDKYVLDKFRNQGIKINN